MVMPTGEVVETASYEAMLMAGRVDLIFFELVEGEDTHYFRAPEGDDLYDRALIHGLEQELDLVSAATAPRHGLSQLHWGGGTPTFISHDEMRALMAETRRHFQLAGDDQGEFSIE